MTHRKASLSRKHKRVVFFSLAFLMLLSSFGIGLQAQIDGGRETPLVRLESRQVEIGEEAVLKLILARTPTGLRRYDISVSVREGSIARISSANKGEAIEGLLFQVLKQTRDAIEFRALSLFETRIQPGARDVVLAGIKVVGLNEGKTWMDAKVTEFVDAEGDDVAPNVESGLLAVVPSSTGLFMIGDSPNAPQDLDGDGLYEDIDGDGRLTLEGVSLFAFNLDSTVIQTRIDYFDFDGDGDIDFDDATTLATLVKEAPTNTERSGPQASTEHLDAVAKTSNPEAPLPETRLSGSGQPAGRGGNFGEDSRRELFTGTIRIEGHSLETSLGTVREDGRLIDINLISTQPLTIAIEFENTSTAMLWPEGRLDIKDTAGETIKSLWIEAFSVIPGKKKLLTCIDEDAWLVPGQYLALGIIDLGTGYLVAGQKKFVIQ